MAFGDIPRDRLAALREAFAKTLVDPAYVAEAKQRGLLVEPVGAEKQMELAGIEEESERQELMQKMVEDAERGLGPSGGLRNQPDEGSEKASGGGTNPET